MQVPDTPKCLALLYRTVYPHLFCDVPDCPGLMAWLLPRGGCWRTGPAGGKDKHDLPAVAVAHPVRQTHMPALSTLTWHRSSPLQSRVSTN